MTSTLNPTLIDTRGMDAKLRRTQVFAALTNSPLVSAWKW